LHFVVDNLIENYTEAACNKKQSAFGLAKKFNGSNGYNVHTP